MKLRFQLVIALWFCVIFFSNAQKGGYAYMRVWDCTSGAAAGTYYMNPQILITFENGESEKIELEPYSEKNEPTTLKMITETLNKMRQKGYTLISNSTTGDQGNLVMDYIFLKPN